MEKITSTPSFRRLIRQIAFVPYLYNRWLTKDVKDQLYQAIDTAEQGHKGEIRLVIEDHLPYHIAYHHGCRQRALDLFGSLRVWDTEHNTGILIYINLREHDLEIIADRGIDSKASDAWQPLLERALIACRTDIANALCDLIMGVGAVLNTHFPSIDSAGNELGNDIIHLK